ncbi:hypothetical protein JD276_13895 [Leucobacter sp. CSA1]|uniref:DUF11 domain-containing protein n=1 Tax=Leucobacter chromiisoli TaxID=2796471 RepID=A0A934UVP2_9MICO|nr:hypothetical protein [Leucobacter chromiisoli]MBK0420125.1 hypothetical protein [Leucobacter chromiisoli]
MLKIESVVGARPCPETDDQGSRAHMQDRGHRTVTGGTRVGRGRGLVAALALGLTVLIGVVIPLGDAAPSFAEESAGGGPRTEAGPRAETELETEAPPEAEAEPPAEDAPHAEGAPPADDPLAAPKAAPIRPQVDPGFCDANAQHYYSLRSSAGAGSVGRAIVNRHEVTGNGTGILPAAPEQLNFDLVPVTTAPNGWNVHQAGSVGVNGLGVGSNGYAYFTNQYEIYQGAANNDSSRNRQKLVDVWRVDLSAGASVPTRVAQHVPISSYRATGGNTSTPRGSTQLWNTYISGGAVSPSGEFTFSYYEVIGSGTAQAARVHVYRLSGGTASKVAMADTPAGTYPGRDSGDIAFNGRGDLFFVIASDTRARQGIIPAQMLRAADPDVPLTGFSLSDELVYTSTGAGTPPGGIAFVRGGNAMWQADSRHTLRNPATLAPGASHDFALSNQRDLGSCIRPSSLVLQKDVRGRFAPSDQFTLTAGVGSARTSLTTTGGNDGLQGERVALTVLAGDTVNFGETAAAGADLQNYVTSHECRNMGTGGAGTLLVEGSGGSGAVQIPSGVNVDIVCTITNEARRPALDVRKTSDPPSFTTVDAGSTIRYTLRFDNRRGTAPAPVDHVDHLRDVLDDADLDAGSIRYGDGGGPAASTAPLDPGVTAGAPDAQQRVEITGTVPAGRVRTVEFTVTVKENSVDAVERQETDAPLAGYRLRNYLTPRGEEPPEECLAVVPLSAGTAEVDCTDHPVRAWTVRKDSQPPDGAMLHTGGNVYYRVTVSNLSREDFRGITIEDDLTETLAATTWATSFPNLVPVPHGISFYDEQDQLIPELTLPASHVPKPSYADGRWSLKTLPFDLPADARKAVVGYVVEVGYRADTSDAARPAQDGSGGDVAAVPNATWVNTVQATAATVEGSDAPVWPNRCAANSEDGAGVPAGDVSGYYDCKTWHTLGESYFHIQKNSTEQNAAGTSVEWNVAGVDFVLADTRPEAENGV